MGKILSFSDFKTAAKPDIPGCFLDTNFLIAITHKEHPFHNECYAVFETLSEKAISLFITHTIRTEFLDYQRRVLITKKLGELIRGEGKWARRASPLFQKIAQEEIAKIDSKTLPAALSDSQIKLLRKKIPPHSEGLHRGWVSFCQFFLSTGLGNSWQEIEEFVNYLNLREIEGSEKKYLTKVIEWTELVKLVGATGVGSHDAMILNAFNCSIFPYLLSTDLDVAYSIKKSSEDKIAVIPDNMFSSYSHLLDKIP